ncbi:hypothetical protein CDAR_24511 [Caerostris darwini]|uniref:Uncharacterized protein n=1 Tax=Caerostris darwini TaxID=1538125 RepID=A0AAV4SHY8_9ARAC|nr:hypothetical protein CDAR_24511 [Caerostris darwini]
MTDLSDLMEFISLFLSKAKHFSADRIAINVSRQRQPFLLTTSVWLVCLYRQLSCTGEMIVPVPCTGVGRHFMNRRVRRYLGGSFHFMASKVFGTCRKNEECLGCRW